MRNKKEINDTLEEQKRYRDGPKPMEFHEHAFNQGWIEALEWVLFSEEEQERIVQRTRLNAILLTQEERNNIIKNTIERMKEPAI